MIIEPDKCQDLQTEWASLRPKRGKQLWSSGPKIDRLKTQDSVLQLGSKSRQKPTSQFKHNQTGFTPCQGRGINWLENWNRTEGNVNYSSVLI